MISIILKGALVSLPDPSALSTLSASARQALDETAALYAKLAPLIPFPEWVSCAVDIVAIRRLKKERDALILAHNYMTPEIYYGVADRCGDSLALAKEAAASDAKTLLVAGVTFMAETAKILNPTRCVLAPDCRAGCALADAVTPEDVRALRQRYPDCPIVAYVNTSAAVKAEVDICCTSSNAQKVVESLKASRVVMLPDPCLAQNVARRASVQIETIAGGCDIHKRYTADDVRAYRASYPHAVVIAHPECRPEVVALADYDGSTSDMARWIETNRPAQVLLLTEVSMSDNLSVVFPDVAFIRPRASCPTMKMVTLAKIRQALETMSPQIQIEPSIADRARGAIQRMMDVA